LAAPESSVALFHTLIDSLLNQTSEFQKQGRTGRDIQSLIGRGKIKKALPPCFILLVPSSTKGGVTVGAAIPGLASWVFDPSQIRCIDSRHLS